MTFGLRCSQPARRPRPASLPFCVPTVENLLRASFSLASRLRLAFRYGCRHQLRRDPSISLDSAHAGHTGADPPVRGRRPRRPARVVEEADTAAPAAGRGRPARTRGSAPPGHPIPVQSIRGLAPALLIVDCVAGAFACPTEARTIEKGARPKPCPLVLPMEDPYWICTVTVLVA